MEMDWKCVRYGDDNPVKKVFKAEPIRTRVQRRPKLRWTDGVAKDVRKIGVPCW